MRKLIVLILSFTLMTACARTGMLNETPYPESEQTSSNITIHRDFPDQTVSGNLVFLIDGVETYRFGKTEDFNFVLGQGNYIFGYKSGFGFWQKSCSVDVEIYPEQDYVFFLKPDCVIELQ